MSASFTTIQQLAADVAFLAVGALLSGAGGKSRGHHHARTVFVYVFSGAIKSENSATGPVKVYKAGEA